MAWARWHAWIGARIAVIETLKLNCSNQTNYNLAIYGAWLYDSEMAMVTPNKKEIIMKPKNQFKCSIHGTEFLLIEQREPTCCHKFAVRCKQCFPTFINWASERTAKDMLMTDPSIETKPYVPGITEFEKRFGRKP